jgi:predicted alpha/beta-fold hydrolase
MKFQPAFGLKNRHIQTSYASIFRKPLNFPVEIEKFLLSDGDFVDAYWYRADNKEEAKAVVVLFHGLTGSFFSPYIQGAMEALHKEGFCCVVMHFRGCSGRDNRKIRSYHSGDTADALEFLHAIKERYLEQKIFAVGYSIGANMLLKLLGEEKENAPIDAAVAVSAPMVLDICADTMQRGVSRFYQERLLKDLRYALKKKYARYDIEKVIGLKKEELKQIKSFWEFDELYTAKVHGFSSAKEYYKKSSAKQYLRDIVIPTLIIHAKDDPFTTEAVIPKKNEVSEAVSLEISEFGGHVGFIAGTALKPVYWLDQRITRYFQERVD